ncbi:hypothetical protein AX777_17540 [Sphingobium yanoikuyae]|jgi:uncharacterized protein YbcV (DUF1398 family)|uniref:DUF1398 domain-containing protein n=1 Tax=Sphingobium yanoikuyae TaxID=13690 RepID=A0A177JYI7_SPHYA|nr:hypothetical protein [Sphingobium yanoikuyae]OAH45411.1 hypothetical protein AX777_17540 [Sphingobium yanoikuyae]
MDVERIAIAKACLNAAHDGRLSFPEIVRQLMDAGFEGYSVDYRRGCQTYYLPDGDNVELDMPHAAGSIAATFDSAAVEALVRWAQANGPDYSYPGFSEKVRSAGCAGYLVSFLGRRVVYYGRTAETRVELFPQ